MKHYLLTIPLAGACMHGYVMTNDKRAVGAALNQMIDKVGDGMILPLVLQTELNDGVGVVRDIISGLGDQARKGLLGAKDFHFSAFITADPELNRQLMELH